MRKLQKVWVISKIPYADIKGNNAQAFASKRSVVIEPESVDDVLHGAFTYLPDPIKLHTFPEEKGRIGPEGENKDQVIAEYIKRNQMPLQLIQAAQSFVNDDIVVGRPPRRLTEVCYVGRFRR